MTVQATAAQATARRWAAEFRSALIAQESWRSQAACRSADPDLFFPISASGRALGQVAEAKAICAGCGVRRQCLEFAVQTRQLHGIWGSLTEQERGYGRQRSGTRPQPAPLGRADEFGGGPVSAVQAAIAGTIHPKPQ